MAKNKGSKWECGECGLVVVVDDPCGSRNCWSELAYNGLAEIYIS